MTLADLRMKHDRLTRQVAEEHEAWKARVAALQARMLPDIEAVAEKVHDSWMVAKRRQGIFSWQPKGEELMVPYGELSEEAKELDRASVRAVYDAIREASGE